MKKLLLLFGIASCFLFFGSGCQTEISPNILQDSTIKVAALLSLRQIKVNHPSATDPFNYIFSLQYDTANKKINIYLDDTTTTNPFDRLVYSYEFNSNGYLINSSTADANGNIKPDFTIVRNGTNQIQQIINFNAEEINGVPYNDTVFYNYQQTGTQTMVQDSVRFHGNNQFNTTVTTYNSQNKITSIQYVTGNVLYTTKDFIYNSQGILANIISNVDTIAFTYDNTRADSNWQNLPLLFLGRDYYILQNETTTSRLSYNFLSYIIEGTFETVYNPLLTAPLLRITRQGYTGSNPITSQTQIVNFTNSFTTDNRLSSVSVLPIGMDPFYFYFKYQ